MNPGTAALGRGLEVVWALADPEADDGLGVAAPRFRFDDRLEEAAVRVADAAAALSAHIRGRSG